MFADSAVLVYAESAVQVYAESAVQVYAESANLVVWASQGPVCVCYICSTSVQVSESHGCPVESYSLQWFAELQSSRVLSSSSITNQTTLHNLAPATSYQARVKVCTKLCEHVQGYVGHFFSGSVKPMGLMSKHKEI